MSNKSVDEKLQLDAVEKKLRTIVEKEREEAKFADEANALFERNLVTFRKYFPDIAEKFFFHKPQKEFHLFLNENGTANIIDYSTKVPMYSENPEKQASDQINSSILNPVTTHQNYLSLKSLENDANFIHVDLLKKIGESYSSAISNMVEGIDLKSKIPSLVIFGIGLGYHLNELFNKIDAEYINIFEPEEDYFYASLFTFDWQSFLKKVDEKGSYLYLSIGVSEEETYTILYERAQTLGPFTISNSFYFQHYPSFKVNALITKLRDEFHRLFMGWGFFDDQLMGLAHSVANVHNKAPYLDLNKTKFNAYRDVPVFVIANGPSLDKDIDKIRELQNSAIIFSCNSATTALLKYGVIPDFHIALERTRETYDFLEFFIDEKYRKEIKLLTLNVMQPEVLDLFNWSGLALKGREAGSCLHQVTELLERTKLSTTLGYCNPVVGNTGLSFAITLGFKNIYLFGVDNGYIDPMHHHSKASMYYDDKGESTHSALEIGGKMTVEGNFGEKVITDHFLFSGKSQMETLLASPESKGVSCFNCSDGAKIKGALPLYSNDIILPSNDVIKEKVIDFICDDLFVKLDDKVNLDNYLFHEEFNNVCNKLIDIIKPKAKSKEEALIQAIEQFRYINYLKESKYAHLFLLLEGEVLYVSSILINLVFSYGMNSGVLTEYEKLKMIWCDFLDELPEYYLNNWKECSQHVFPTEQFT